MNTNSKRPSARCHGVAMVPRQRRTRFAAGRVQRLIIGDLSTTGAGTPASTMAGREIRTGRVVADDFGRGIE
ncbi:hypothetical protein STAQ_20540 [Allostella sp. ATCC 35155]|nr:hypothetical protein STAQ_20540 [Stella sp. ATCC 35155]